MEFKDYTTQSKQDIHADGLHKQYIVTVRHCPNECQRAKDNGRQYGKLPPRDTATVSNGE